MQCLSSICDLHPCISDTANLSLSRLILEALLLILNLDCAGEIMGASPRSVCLMHTGSSRKEDPLRAMRGCSLLLFVDDAEE